MEYSYKKKVVFVSYASDGEKIKDIVFDACNRYSHANSEETKYIFIPTDYDKCGRYEAGPRVQSIINEQILKSDVFIEIFWKRFGSPTGTINKDTGKQYESGMQEEFDIALRKKKDDNNFKIMLLFKKINNDSSSSLQDNEQIEKVIKFQEGMKEKKIWYKDIDEDSQAGIEVYTFLENNVKGYLHDTLSAKSTKEKYPIIKTEDTEDYLERTVLLYEDAISTEVNYFRLNASDDLINILEKENRIILLSDAGNGKTTELKRIMSVFSSTDAEYYPIMVRLNLYTNEKIEDLFPDYWKDIPKNRLLILLDGYDEIKSDNKTTAVIEIEKFSERHKYCKIVISCRTNFYNSKNNNYSGTLKSFKAYILNHLSGDVIDKYVKQYLANKSDYFYEATQKNKSSVLLGIPFYLKMLVGEYLESNKLPNSRNDIFEMLINNRIQIDEEHYRTTNNYDFTEFREVAFKNFEKLALIMEVLCRNYITNKEYCAIIPDKNIRNVLMQNGIWGKEGNKWQFEHNTFQEYLASKALNTVSFNKQKMFLTFPPSYRIIIPSWINTLSFLMNCDRSNEIKKWILKIQPELTIKFEPDRINDSLKEKIFIRIFNNYKRKKIWIDRDKYDLYELAKFSECKETVKYLMRFINVNEYHTTIGNAINILTLMEIPIEYKDNVRNTIVNISLTYNDDYIRNCALILLGVQKLNNKKVIESLYNSLGKSDNDWIRYGMYYLIEDSNYLDDYIEYFLNGLRFYHESISDGDKEPRIGNEFWHLESGLQKVTRPESVKKILDYLIENPNIVHMIGFDRVISKLMQNFSSIYSKTKENIIFQKICDLYLLLNEKYYQNESTYCLSFFNNSGTRIKAFNYIYKLKAKLDSYDYCRYLAFLSARDSLDFIADEYLSGHLSEQEIWYYHRNLVDPLFTSFNKIINEKSNNKFVFAPRRDFKKEDQARIAKNVNFLFNRDAFIAEVYSVYENEKILTLNKGLIDDIRYHRYDEIDKYSDKVLKELSNILDGGDKTFEEIKDIIVKSDWEYFSVKEIYNYLVNSYEIVFKPEVIDKLKEWCQKKILDVNFKTELKQNGSTTTTSILAIMLHYFLRTFKFKYPKDKLLDLISFDWHGAGIDYIEEFLSEDEMAERIINNLKGKDHNDYELRNYYQFCIKYKISGSKISAHNEILNVNRDIDIRKLALKLLDTLSKDNRIFLSLLNNISDPFKWEIVDLLIHKNNKKIKEYLIDILETGDETDQNRAANHLMSMQDMRGLRFYTETLEKKKVFEHGWNQPRSLSKIKDPKALKYLIRLLKLSYDKKLRQDKYDTLYKVVENSLTNIALLNYVNLCKVKKMVTKFILENKKKNSLTNFLYAYLERLERQFYISKSQNISVDEALSKLEKIKI